MAAFAIFAEAAAVRFPVTDLVVVHRCGEIVPGDTLASFFGTTDAGDTLVVQGAGEPVAAEKLLREAIDDKPEAVLVRLYGELVLPDALAPLDRRIPIDVPSARSHSPPPSG